MHIEKIGGQTLYNGDCLEVMTNIDKNSIDIVLTSPPYNTSRKNGTLKNHQKRYISYNDNKTDSEYIKWTLDVFNLINNILKINGCIIYNISYSVSNPSLLYLTLAEIINKTNFCIAEHINWKKDCAIPNNVSSNKLTRICESVFVFCRKNELNTFLTNKKILYKNEYGQTIYENKFNLINAKNNDGSCEIHKATYSCELVDKLLDIYSYSKDNIVFDPFLGTGTTLLSCEKLGLKGIGSEIEKQYFDIAYSRIASEYNQQKFNFDESL